MTGAKHAPGHPGIEPRWTSSAKSAVGTALTPERHVWFTVSHGILDEVYWPRIDQACIRDMGLLVTGPEGFVSEEKRDARSVVRGMEGGVPLCRVVNTCTAGRYRIDKDILADPRSDVVLTRVHFAPSEGSLDGWSLFALLAPHLGNRGAGNTAWLGDYKGVPMLFAERDGLTLALASSAPWRARSVGFVGVSDGWQDVVCAKRPLRVFERAEDGNVALTGEVDVGACGGRFVLALGFGLRWQGAAQHARRSLLDGWDAAEAAFVAPWKAWQETLHIAEADATGTRMQRTGASVLRVHEAKAFSGATIASLSIPWGFAKGDDDLGGYHLVWPRDMVETASGLLAAGAHEQARVAVAYLRATQEADGHWAQNMWLDGEPFWNGVQMDETALPMLLVALSCREGALDAQAQKDLWPMVRKAAGYVVRNGPVTEQDRWEEDPGYSPFTLAAEVAALLVAADLAERVGGEPELARYLRETADAWNADIERWTFAEDTEFSRRLGVRGYYVRIAPPETADAASPLSGFVPIKNRPPGQSTLPATEVVSPDALALVRMGLRAADDPRIVDTVKVIDAQLRVETPSGPSWRRYDDDGYGEHEDGAPFDGTGVGRLWPLLTGERGHYELAAGRPAEARRLLRALEAFASDGGLLPEQVWDSPQLPGRELFPGHPSGSAMPLCWAHAEHLALHRSLADGRVFSMPAQTHQRYVVEGHGADFSPWRFSHKCRSMARGRTLRIETTAPVRARFTDDGWTTSHDAESRDTGIGLHATDLPTRNLEAGRVVIFTLFWPQGGTWQGEDFSVRVEDR